MDFLQLAAQRYSVRKFQEKKLPREVLESILKAGMLAPTAHNNQPQRIPVIDEPKGLEALDRATKCRFGAPAALLICYDKDACWKRDRYDGKASGEVDASIVTTHMMLAAADLGIGSTWVMHFDPVAMRREFSVPEEYEPVALLVMGYPAPDAVPAAGHSTFEPEEKLVFYNRF